MKKAVGVLAVIGIVVAGWFAYQQHNVSELNAAIGPHVKAVSLRLSAAVEANTSPGNMSWAEAFRKAEEAIKASDDAVLAVQSLDGSAKPALVAAASEYIKSSQSLVRSLNKANRSLFELNNAMDQFKEAVGEMKSTSGYSFEFASKSAERARERSTKAIAELETASVEARAGIDSFKSQRVKAAQTFKDEILLPDETLEALAKHFAKDPKS